MFYQKDNFEKKHIVALCVSSTSNALLIAFVVVFELQDAWMCFFGCGITCDFALLGFRFRIYCFWIRL